MSRIVGIVGIGEESESDKIIYSLSKNIVATGKCVAVFDFCFINNSLGVLMGDKKYFDLKDYFVGKAGLNQIVGEIENNLYFIKSDCFGFDYMAHKVDIQKLICDLAFKMDYIFINANGFDYQNITFLKQIISEVLIVFDNSIWSIKNLAKFIKFFEFNNDFLQINLVMNNSKIMGQLSKKYLSKNEIELALKKEVLFEFPKFINHNFLGVKKSLRYKKKLDTKFCNSFITNKKADTNYSKFYNGLFGKIRKCLFEKFE